jgi:hypothetical protein
MKKLLSVMVVLALLMSVMVSASCSSNEQPRESLEIPTEASLPNTMPIDKLLDIVNTVLEFEEGYEFDKQDAEILDIQLHEDDNEIYYIFNRPGMDAILFADRDTDAFTYGLFRMRGMDEATALGVLTVAGVFLMALEPNEFENMLRDVIPVSEEGEAFVEWWLMFDFEPMISHGEVWAFVNQGSMFQIIPSHDLTY